jgi:hypothetical protein
MTRQEQSRRYYLKHRQGNHVYNRSASLYYRIAHPEHTLLSYARRASKATGVPFTITESDVVIPDRCPILGIVLVEGAGRGHRRGNSPCLDRVAPELGFVRGNVMVVSWRSKANRKAAAIKEAARTRRKKWREDHPGVAAKQHTDYRLAHPERYLLENARTRSLNAGVPFTITESDITILDRCPILDIPLIKGEGRRTDGSPSLYLVDAGLGYVPGNVIVMSWKAKAIRIKDRFIAKASAAFPHRRT